MSARSFARPFVAQFFTAAAVALLLWWLSEREQVHLLPPPPPAPAIDLTASRTTTTLFQPDGTLSDTIVAESLAHARTPDRVALTAVRYQEERRGRTLTGYASAGRWFPDTERLELNGTVRVQRLTADEPPLVLATEMLTLWPGEGGGEAPTETWLYQGAHWGRGDTLTATDHFTKVTLAGNAFIHWVNSLPAARHDAPPAAAVRHDTPPPPAPRSPSR